MFVVTTTLVYILLTISVHTSKSWTHQQLTYTILNWNLYYAKRQPICLPTHDTKTKYIFILLISLSGDIEPNPGPAKKTQSTIVDCVSTQSHGTREDYAAMDEIYGTTNPAENCPHKIMNSLKNPTYKGSIANAKVLTSAPSPSEATN